MGWGEGKGGAGVAASFGLRLDWAAAAPCARWELGGMGGCRGRPEEGGGKLLES